MQGSEPGCVEVVRCGQVTLVRRSRTVFGEPVPLEEERLQDLNVPWLKPGCKVLASGVLVDQSSLPEWSWEQQTNRPSEQHPEEGYMPQQEQPEVHRRRVGHRGVRAAGGE